MTTNSLHMTVLQNWAGFPRIPFCCDDVFVRRGVGEESPVYVKLANFNQCCGKNNVFVVEQKVKLGSKELIFIHYLLDIGEI